MKGLERMKGEKRMKTMKDLKKTMAAALALVLACSLCACGVKVEEKSADKGETAIAPARTPAPATSDKEKVTLKVVDWSDSTQERRKVFNEKFMKENPNVTVEYTVLTIDQFKETVISAIKAGNAPDLFPLPSGMTLGTALKEKWYVPLNDYMPDSFFSTLAPGSLNEGITSMDGKNYVIPEAANIINTLVYYNKTVLKEAGIDVNQLPKTWTEFSDACKKVSDAGKGKYFGLIDSGAQTGRLEVELRSLASLDGGKCGDSYQILMTDGKNTLDSPSMVKAFDYFDKLVKEGCFHPNSVTLKAPEARALFAQNQAAFIVQGAWCISTWRKDNPDLDFGVMELPVPDDGMKGKLPYTGSGGWMGISSGCKHPDVAAKYLMEIYSEDYQSGLVEDGGFVSVIDAVNKNHMTDPVMQKYYEINGEEAALVPDPVIGNPQASDVYAQVFAVTPGLGEIAQGVLAQNGDYKAELKTLSDKTQAEWLRAIDAAKENGAKISPADFEFPNWDPMKNYTGDLYKSK